MTAEAGVVRLFPLAEVVLFPGVDLHLHVFEPRYRDLVRDAMAGDRTIAMAVLRDGARHRDRRAEIFPLGCAGRITAFSPLPDGRSRLVLKGFCRFEIERELLDEETRYRRARVRWLREDAPEDLGLIEREVRNRVERLLERQGGLPAATLWRRLPKGGAGLVNALAFHLGLSAAEKLWLLESAGLEERARRLRQLLDFQLAGPATCREERSWH